MGDVISSAIWGPELINPNFRKYQPDNFAAGDRLQSIIRSCPQETIASQFPQLTRSSLRSRFTDHAMIMMVDQYHWTNLNGAPLCKT